MGENGTAPWIRFDAVEIDGDGHRLRVNGVEVPLERKAFAVLLLLASHPGRVFARDEILDAVWGHAHVTPGVLNRIVTLLRQALGESGGSHRYLHTVHGVGYRFDRPAAEPASASAVPVPPADVPAERREAVSAQASVEQAPGEAEAAARPRRLPRGAAWATALAALLAIAGWTLWPRPPAAPPAVADSSGERSIAVLPFVDASTGGDQQFFSDGLSESLIATLSQFGELRVIGRSSSFQFRGGKEDARAIGTKLGVTHLVEGSVRRAGDDVRIAVELVRTADGSTLWSKRYDRSYRDLFVLQDEIALAVAGALQVRLLHRMPGAVDTGRPASGNLAAYNAYLRGTYAMNDPRTAIEAFTEATRLDPAYAQAWSWLGFMRTQYTRGSLSGDAARASYAQAREEIETALRLAPDFGQAHAIRANLMSTGDHDWNGALAEFRTALSLVSDTDPSHGAISRLLATLGRLNESIEERRKYIAGDPLAAFARVYLAELLASLGRLDEAEESLREAAELEPDGGDWYAGERSYYAILRGDAESALAEAKKQSPGRWRERTLALALQIGNDRAAADAALKHLIDTDGQAKGDAYAIARAYALRGDADKAFDWLQRDWDRGDSGVHRVLFEPLLLRFRDDPRFAEYCRRTGLPSPDRSEALSVDRIRVTSGAKR